MWALRQVKSLGGAPWRARRSVSTVMSTAREAIPKGCRLGTGETEVDESAQMASMSPFPPSARAYVRLRLQQRIHRGIQLPTPPTTNSPFWVMSRDR